MDVFLVPVAADRYELYCEEPDDPAPADGAEPPKGMARRILHRFKQTLAEAEHERSREPDPSAARLSLAARIKARVLRWVAESIAEQRLLWQLRGRADATLIHPDDLTDAQAHQVLRRSLQRDWERHRFWMIVDALGGVASVLLILVPGPNLIGYYFLFRIVGHYLSLRGARRGERLTGEPRAGRPRGRDRAAARASSQLLPAHRDPVTPGLKTRPAAAGRPSGPPTYTARVETQGHRGAPRVPPRR
jgi:hypothetical protein